MTRTDQATVDAFYAQRAADCGPTISANVTPPDQRIDPQQSPWAREKNVTALNAALATFSASELGPVLAAALLQRFGALQANNVLARAERITKGNP